MSWQDVLGVRWSWRPRRSVRLLVATAVTTAVVALLLLVLVAACLWIGAGWTSVLVAAAILGVWVCEKWWVVLDPDNLLLWLKFLPGIWRWAHDDDVAPHDHSTNVLPPGHVPVDRVAYRRLRWQARSITTAAAVPFAFLLINLIGFARTSGEEHKVAAWWFFQLCLYTIVATTVVWWAWRRSWRARPVVLRHDAGPGATIGVPELDAAPRAHLGLSGDQPPPRRW